MKSILALLVLLLNFSAFAMQPGVAFYDLGLYEEERNSYTDFNKWIRTNALENFGPHVSQIIDSNIQDPDQKIGSTFLKTTVGTYIFVVYQYELEPEFSIRVIKNVPLSETDFRLDVYLEERAAVFMDQSEHELKLVFPIAHGGLSSDNSKIMTPIFREAWIDKHTIIARRRKPSYYKGQPFLRVMTDKVVSRGWTGIGLHIKMNNELKRSPDSHGCVRLRHFDLQTAFIITRHGPNRHTPMTIRLRNTEEVVEHPYPLWNTSYKKVRWYKNAPHIRRGSDGLIVFHTIYEDPTPLIDEMEEL